MIHHFPREIGTLHQDRQPKTPRDQSLAFGLYLDRYHCDNYGEFEGM
jgi:hypothetical protein